MNVNRVKINLSGGLDFAPDMLWPNPGRPTDEEYAAAGYMENAVEPPNPPEGKIVSSIRYEEQNGKVVAVYEYTDVPPPALDDFDSAMEQHLTAERYARGYTTREPDAYLSSSVERWAQDARDWVAHRDAVMEYALGVMNAVKSGQMEIPTLEQFSAQLPRITWTIE